MKVTADEMNMDVQRILEERNGIAVNSSAEHV